jgi:hypothetical protein|tara:strand:+ start:415 stop:717 length:303 start_codon:yes stop_codon:yes gene_type:complete
MLDNKDWDRFKRLEETLDKLSVKLDTISDVIIAMARIEEKNLAAQQRLDHHDDRLSKHSNAIDSLNLKSAASLHKTNFNEWFIRALIVTIVGALAFMVRG